MHRSLCKRNLDESSVTKQILIDFSLNLNKGV